MKNAEKKEQKEVVKEDDRLNNMTLWEPEAFRQATAFDVFEEEYKTRINARVAQERTSTKDNLGLYNIIKSSLWNELSVEEREEFARKAEVRNEEHVNRPSSVEEMEK